VARLAGDVHALHHDALVHADWLEAGRLADYGMPSVEQVTGDQRLGAAHGTFLIRRGEDDQRLLEGAVGIILEALQ